MVTKADSIEKNASMHRLKLVLCMVDKLVGKPETKNNSATNVTNNCYLYLKKIYL